MEMRNKLMSKSSLIGKGLSRINESAFFHHKQTIVPNEAFDEFLIELWENYNTAWLYKEKSSLLAAIDDYQKIKQKLNHQMKIWLGSIIIITLIILS